MTSPVLEAKGLVKLFGRVVGLAGVDLTLFPGEVLAVKQPLSSVGAKSKRRSKSQHGGNDQQLAMEGGLAEGDCSHT